MVPEVIAGTRIMATEARAVVLVAATTMAARAGLRLQTREVAAAVAEPRVIPELAVQVAPAAPAFWPSAITNKEEAT